MPLLTDRQRVLGPDDLDTLETQHDLAYWLAEAGQLDASMSTAEAALAGRMRALGPEHLDTILTKHNLGTFCVGASHPDGVDLLRGLADQAASEAVVAEARALLEVQRRVLGDAHAHTSRTADLLDEIA